MEDLIPILLIVLIIGAATFYIIRSKKRGQKWKEEKVADFEKALEMPDQDAIPVIISKNISPQIVRTAEALCKKKTKGIWVLPYEPGDMPDVHSDSFLFVKREVEG